MKLKLSGTFFKKTINVSLIIILLFGSIMYPYDSVHAAPSNNDCGNTVSSNNTVPAGLHEYNLNGQRINLNLYYTWGIVAYGTTGNLTNDYDDIPSNNFFKGIQTDPNLESTYNANGGRFDNKSGVCGEYRYFGFDYNGNLYPDMMFKNDADGHLSNSEKQWVVNPWLPQSQKGLPDSYAAKPAKNGNIYDGLSIGDPLNQPFFANLDRSLNFEINNGIQMNTNGTSIFGGTPYNDNKYKYAYIDQPATAITPGYATFYQKNKHAASGFYYQTFELLPTGDSTTGERKKTPVTANIVIDEVQPYTIPIGQDTLTLRVHVDGTLKDENFQSLRDKTVNYTRDDIKDWTFKILDAHGNITQTKTGIAKINNTGTASFDVQIPIIEISPDPDNKYPIQAIAIVNTLSNEPLTSPTAVQQALFKRPNGTPALKINPTIVSRFKINPIIAVKPDSMMLTTSAPVGYGDFSEGSITSYVLTAAVTSGATFVTRILNYTPSNITSAGDGLKTYINDVLASLPPFDVNDPLVHLPQFTVKVTQKAINSSGLSATDTHDTQVIVGSFVPDYADVRVDIPDDWYDIVKLPVTDTSLRVVNKVCTIDGAPIDNATLFGSNYVFGLNTHGLHEIACTFTSDQGYDTPYIKWVNIHDTKPRVQLTFNGLFKQNRTMSVANNSQIANDPFVYNTYPNTYYYDFYDVPGEDNTQLRKKTDTAMLKEFLAKKPGVYGLRIYATNTLGRTSDTKIYTVEITPDYKPAIILHPFDVQVGRTDKVRLNYNVVSTDGDQIAAKKLELWYDASNNGTYNQLISTQTGNVTEIVPPAGKLGKYKLVAWANESWTEATYPEFITSMDYQEAMFTNYFEVDNYKPISDLYIDQPLDKPTVDLFFLLDSALTQSKTDWIKGNKVSITNSLIDKNVIPSVDIWDMKTYTYSQGASTTNHTGSYPPSTTPYSSGGYSGTLSLSSVSDQGSYHDDGHYSTVVDVAGHYNSVVDVAGHYVYGTSPCSHTQSGYVFGSGSTSPDFGGCPINGSYSYSSTSDVVNGVYYGYWYTRSWSGSYQTQTWVGDTYKNVWVADTYKTVWVSNMVWYPNYYGTYNGTIYMDVRQPYNNSFFRNVSDKYVVYISDGNISQLSDLQYAVNSNGAKLILVTQASAQSQTTYAKYMLNNKAIDAMVSDVLDYIGLSSPAITKILRQVGEPIITKTGTIDLEGDLLTNNEEMIYQDPNYFDNSQGYFTGLTNSYNTSVWKPYSANQVFNKPGLYTLIRRIKDNPSADPLFSNYSYYSNESIVTIAVHRKPIADVTLDWDYDAVANNYKTIWVDQSYDLDHNISSPIVKGIVSRVLSLTNNSTGVILNTIPTVLYAGSYTLTYSAKDIEGAWSDPVTKSFTLAASPPMQFKSNLKTELTTFSLGSIPASESIRAYQLWTRYPYSVNLGLQMGSYINQTVPYYTGTKSVNDINWNDVVMQIPATTPDGPYTFNISANASGGVTASNAYSVTVSTPINLVPSLPAANDLLVVSYPGTLTATTTKYPTSTIGTLFYGTAYAQNVTLNPTTTSTGKSWIYTTSSFPNVPDGNYTIRFTSTLPSAKNQIVDVPIKVTHNTPPFGDFNVYTYNSAIPTMPKYEGDTLHIDSVGIGDNEHDQLSVRYEVTDPLGAKIVDQSYTFNYPYPTTGPTFQGNAVGTYSVKLTISDGKAAAVILTKTFTVIDLSIQGYVDHADRFEEFRKAYNRNASGDPQNPRTSDMYVAGESFVLSANTSSTTTSNTKASSVIVVRAPFDFSTLLTSNTKLNWTGKMVDNNFNEKLTDGNYTFSFNATWSNGHKESVDVTIRIKGDVNLFLNASRLETN
jgi:hypothetical protein